MGTPELEARGSGKGGDWLGLSNRGPAHFLPTLLFMLLSLTLASFGHISLAL